MSTKKNQTRNSVSKTSKKIMQLLSSPVCACTSKKSKILSLPPVPPKEDEPIVEDKSPSLLWENRENRSKFLHRKVTAL